MENAVLLIAISVPGTTFIVRDEAGQTWLHGPPADGRPQLADPACAEALIDEFSLERVDQLFADWPALEAFRLEHIERASRGLTLPLTALGIKDIEFLVGAAEQFVNRGEHDRATPMLLSLRTAPALSRGTPLYRKLVALIASDPAFADS